MYYIDRFEQLLSHSILSEFVSYLIFIDKIKYFLIGFHFE